MSDQVGDHARSFVRIAEPKIVRGRALMLTEHGRIRFFRKRFLGPSFHFFRQHVNVGALLTLLHTAAMLKA